MENNNSKQMILSILGVVILVVAVVGVSFAAFSYSKTGEKVNTITTGTITMSYSEDTNGINLSNALPMSDDQGKALSGSNNVFDFTVTATINGSGNTTINYDVTATKESDSTLDDSAVKVYLTSIDNSADTQVLAPTKVSALTKTGSSEASGAPNGQYKLTTGTFTSTTTRKYRLRMWVSDDYTDPTGGSYTLKVNVYGAAAAL